MWAEKCYFSYDKGVQLMNWALKLYGMLELFFLSEQINFNPLRGLGHSIKPKKVPSEPDLVYKSIVAFCKC